MKERIAQLREDGTRCPNRSSMAICLHRSFSLIPWLSSASSRWDGSSMYQPKGPILAHFSEDQWDEGLPMPNEKIGLFGEFCFPVKDLAVSIAFWTKAWV
ncbi:MAG: hypothetical protein R3B47_16045 [Bacteroidia bacterium]